MSGPKGRPTDPHCWELRVAPPPAPAVRGAGLTNNSGSINTTQFLPQPDRRQPCCQVSGGVLADSPSPASRIPTQPTTPPLVPLVWLESRGWAELSWQLGSGDVGGGLGWDTDPASP